MTDAIANWQWLIPLSRRSEAVVMATPTDPAAEFLTLGFDRTRHFDPATDASGFDASWRAAFAERSLDCIATPRAHQPALGRATELRMLRTMKQSLRAGTGVYVAIEAIQSGTPASRLGALRRSRQERLMRAAGFDSIRSFYLVGTPELARHFVPIDKPMLLAWDSAMESRSPLTPLRRAFIRAGLHAMLFHYRLIVGHA